MSKDGGVSGRGKLWWLAVSLLLLLAAALAGCNSAPAIWPGDRSSGRVRYFYIPPDPPMPAAQAIGTIKNLQTRFCTFQGNTISALDVDRFGVRVRANWTETYSGTNYVPTYGGLFVGRNYVPTYGGSYQPWQKTVRKEETAVVPFNRVNEVRLIYYGDINRPYKWGVYFAIHAVVGGTAFRFRDQAAALDFAAAAAALIRAQKKDLSRKGQLGIYWADLTPAQRKDLANAGLSAGAVVVWVYKGGPAEKSGIRSGDVIAAVNGTPVTSTGEGNRRIAAGGPEATFTVLRRKLVSRWTWTRSEYKVMGWGRGGRRAGNVAAE